MPSFHHKHNTDNDARHTSPQDSLPLDPRSHSGLCPGSLSGVRRLRGSFTIWTVLIRFSLCSESRLQSRSDHRGCNQGDLGSMSPAQLHDLVGRGALLLHLSPCRNRSVLCRESWRRGLWHPSQAWPATAPVQSHPLPATPHPPIRVSFALSPRVAWGLGVYRKWAGWGGVGVGAGGTGKRSGYLESLFQYVEIRGA